MKRVILAVVVVLAAGPAYPQREGRHPAAAKGPKVEIKGKIEKIRIAVGQGMPSLEVRESGKTVTVLLGSMRYLMEQDFQSRAGDEVEVRGFRMEGGIVAITVTIGGKTLRLRDEAGLPLWMGGRRGPAAKSGA